MQIGNHSIGPDSPPYLVMESGATHSGYASAERITRAVAASGAQAIKWQVVYADDLMYPDRDADVAYTNADGQARKESMYAALKRRELYQEQWAELCCLAHSLHLDFIATPSSERAVNTLIDMGTDAIKVAKGDQNHFKLIEYIGQAICNNAPDGQLAIILDGRERMADVNEAYDILSRFGLSDIAIMHCPSGYPSAIFGVHLAAIPLLRQSFPDCAIGYADHSMGYGFCREAYVMGASVIEKTVTEDKATDAVEHGMSLDLSELRGFVEAMTATWEAMGQARVVFSSRVNPSVRRGVYAAEDLWPKDEITEKNIEFKRPEVGIPASEWQDMVGKRAIVNIRKGEAIERQYFN